MDKNSVVTKKLQYIPWKPSKLEEESILDVIKHSSILSTSDNKDTALKTQLNPLHVLVQTRVKGLCIHNIIYQPHAPATSHHTYWNSQKWGLVHNKNKNNNQPIKLAKCLHFPD